jgi:endonuclease/exonuclease/phosphatase family metal-dependent hydrolase
VIIQKWNTRKMLRVAIDGCIFHLTEQTRTILIVSWNHAGENYDCRSIMPILARTRPLIVAFSSSECGGVIVPSYSRRISDDRWRRVQGEILCDLYDRLHSVRFQGISLSVFYRRHPALTYPLPSVNTSIWPGAKYSLLPRKGAVCISTTFTGIKFAFVAAHLEAHAKNAVSRLHQLEMTLKNVSLTHGADINFVAGDLNFRVDAPRFWTDRQIKLGDLDAIVKRDQLTNLIDFGDRPNWLKGWREPGQIRFRPTYKLNPGTRTYDSSNKMRVPSYTDRVLYRASPKYIVTTSMYEPLYDTCGSDHYPLLALLDVHEK